MRIAGVEVGKVTKVERAQQGRRRRGRDDADQGQRAGRSTRTRQLKIRPRIFLEGNFFVDLTPGTPRRRSSPTATTIPVNQTATPVQFDQVLTALQSDTREDLKTLLREYAHGARRAGRQGLQPLDPVLEAAPTATRRSSPRRCSASASTTSRATSTTPASSPARSTATREPLKALITTSTRPPARSRARSGNLEAAIAELPRTLRAAQPGARRAQRVVPAAARLRARRCARASSPRGPTHRRHAAARSRSCAASSREPELRGLTADLRPTVPALAELSQRERPARRAGARRRRAARTRSILPVDARTSSPDKQFPADRARSTRRLPKPFPGLAGESRSGDANGQWFRVLAAGGTEPRATRPRRVRHDRAADPRRQPAEADKRARRCDENVPCETQQTPDLRSTRRRAAAADARSTPLEPAFKDRYGEGAPVRRSSSMKRQLKREGLADKLKVIRQGRARSSQIEQARGRRRQR